MWSLEGVLQLAALVVIAAVFWMLVLSRISKSATRRALSDESREGERIRRDLASGGISLEEPSSSLDDPPEPQWSGRAGTKVDQLATPGIIPRPNSAHDFMEQQERDEKKDALYLEGILGGFPPPSEEDNELTVGEGISLEDDSEYLEVFEGEEEHQWPEGHNVLFDDSTEELEVFQDDEDDPSSDPNDDEDD